MPLSSAGMVFIANALQDDALLFAQLHSGLAGVSGTDNIALAGRQPAVWATPGGTGSFGLASQISFTGGTPGTDVYSVTLWGAETAGTFYGEYALTGDTTFNFIGEYQVTAIDFTGTTS